jgi:hypothetical protein
MFAPHQTGWLNQERAVVAMNDGGSWLFSADGIQQPFEEPESYKARRVADRFTDEMLERYCNALGIELYNESFYGMKAAGINTVQKLPASREMRYKLKPIRRRRTKRSLKL